MQDASLRQWGGCCGALEERAGRFGRGDGEWRSGVCNLELDGDIHVECWGLGRMRHDDGEEELAGGRWDVACGCLHLAQVSRTVGD